MLLDYANNGDPDSVVWADQFGNEYDVDEVYWVDKNGTRETLVWKRRRALTIVIANQTNSTNLASRIASVQDSEEPYEYVDFIIYAGSVVGPITTGNLSSFKEVTLTNGGEIQGVRTTGKGGNGLTVTSSGLLLTNNGHIRGAGGRGGNGGSGSTYTKEVYTTTQYYLAFNGDGNLNGGGTFGAFRYDSGPTLAAGWYWDGVNVYEQPGETEVWLQTPRVGNVQYFRSLDQHSYGNGLEGHPISKRTFSTVKVYTGAGGAGGYGRGYNASATSGTAGKTSSGVTGGRGGNGGNWETSGTSGLAASDGSRTGLTGGYAGGVAISGASLLEDGSKL